MSKSKFVFFVITVISFLILIIYKNQDQKIEEKSEENSLVQAGHYLFFDTRLSFNNTKSCASCHDPKFAFSDGYRRSITASGDIVLHNAPSLINVASQNYFDWASPHNTTLEKQHKRPLFAESPVELGAKGYEISILRQLKSDSIYKELLPKAFPGDKDSFTFSNIITAIAAYVQTLKSYHAPYDAFVGGDKMAISESALRGMKLFASGRLKCASCHSSPDFSMAFLTRNRDSIYYNNGLYNIGNYNQYPAGDQGLMNSTGKQEDSGKFKTPSLRNVSLTAPYMHDGSVNSLEEVIDIYAGGGRNIIVGPNKGDGKKNKFKDRRISGFLISKEERKDLINFLFSLTDSTISVNPKFQNPW